MKKPTNENEFNALMNDINDILIAKNVPIAARPIHAFKEICAFLNIELPLISYGRPIPNNYEGDSFSAHIHKWFEDRYGNRLKIDFSITKIVIVIKNDAFRCRIPKVFGSGKFILDDSFTKRRNISVGYNNSPPSPIYINVYELIDDLSLSFIKSLSINEKKEIMKYFSESFNSLYQLNELTNLPYKNEAMSDLKVAVDSIFEHNINYGLSKWSSLQFSEKIMKGFLEMNKIQFNKTHNLNKLKQELEINNIAILPDSVVNRIQCSADVRYNKNLVNQQEAIDSHHASLELLKYIFKDYKSHIKQFN